MMLLNNFEFVLFTRSGSTLLLDSQVSVSFVWR